MKPNQKKALAFLLCSIVLFWAAGVGTSRANMMHTQQETITFNTLYKLDGEKVSEYCAVTLQGNTQVVEAACSDILKPTVADLHRRYPLIALNVVINGESLNKV